MTAAAMPVRNEILDPGKFLEEVFPIPSDASESVSQRIMQVRIDFAKAVDVRHLSVERCSDFLYSLSHPNRFKDKFDD